MGSTYNLETASRSIVRLLAVQYPEFQIVEKQKSWFMKFLGLLLRIFGIKTFDKFTTTVGYTIYIPKHLYPLDYASAELYEILRHERIHLQQYAKYGIFYGGLYLFCFPLWWTWRARFESEAYTQSILAYVHARRLLGQDSEGISGYKNWKEFLVRTFTDSSYVWMCKDKMRVIRWFDEVWKIANKTNICEDLNYVSHI